MIKRITYYLMQCDRCQEFLREQDGVNADGFSSVDDAEKAAKEAGWSVQPAFHLCPSCWEKYSKEKAEK